MWIIEKNPQFCSWNANLVKWISSLPTTPMWVKFGEAVSAAVHWDAVSRAMPALYQLTVRTHVLLAAVQACWNEEVRCSSSVCLNTLKNSKTQRVHIFTCAAYNTCGNKKAQLLHIYLVLFSWFEGNYHLCEDVILKAEAIMPGKGDLLILKCIGYVWN